MPEQQPSPQVIELQPEHCPSVLQVCATGVCGHAAHAKPPLPHLLMSPLPEKHVLFSQHPLLQPTSSQTQAPATQCKLAPHGASMPQRQAPVAEQPSDSTSPQFVQVPPLAPQLESVRVLQLLPSQQPPKHEMSSQVQVPPTQC